MSGYVENGYVEVGYVEGGSIVSATGGSEILFYVSGGNLSEEELISQIKNDIGETSKMVSLFIPETNKIMLVTKDGEVSFLGNSTEVINQIATLTSRVEEVANNIINIGVTMTAPDGTVIATPTVVKDGTTFTYDVPESLSGVEYSVVLDVSVCDGCGD